MSGEQSVIIVDPSHGVDPPEKPPRKGRKEPSYKRTGLMKSIREGRPDFVGKTELAHHLQCDTGSINHWIADGLIPPPHSRPGEKHPLWRRDHYEEFVKMGRWPREAWQKKA